MRLLLTLILLLSAICEGAEVPAAVEVPPSVQTLQKIVLEAMQEKQIPGCVAAFVYDGQAGILPFGVANRERRIPVTGETIFEIASVTKVFTSTALAVEILRGKMALKDPVTNFLPAIHNAQLGIRHVRLVDLATHTSSLPRDPPPYHGHPYNARLLMSFLAQWRPSYPIGTQYVYSNLAYGVIGYAVANVEKTNYGGAIERLILGPLGMNMTEIFVPPALNKEYAQGYDKTGKMAPHYRHNAWPGGGALRSTGRDMLSFLLANMGLKGPEELQKAMQLAQQGSYKVNDHLTMGLGWQRYTHPGGILMIDKNGGVDGFSSYIGMLANQKRGVVLLANKGSTQLTEVGRKILVQWAKN